MHFFKALLYDIILVAQILIALTTPNMINSLYDVKSKSSSKINNSFANKAQNFETQVIDEIDKQLQKRQIWVC